MHLVLSLRSVARIGVGLGIPGLLIGVLARPLWFTNPQDWLGHLWLMWHQSETIKANHLPSFFLNYSNSVFYPEYAFYGGTLYALVGTASLLLGDAPLATYIATYCIGFATAYGGWYWIARMTGLGRWQAHVPGFVFITSAGYLTIVYARGDWPEFLAISMIPLIAAAGLSILRADRLRFWPALALAGSGVVFFGSHSMTLLWGSTTLLLLGFAIVTFVPQTRGAITRRRLMNVLSVAIPALLVSAWFLLPELAYGKHTFAGSGYNEGARFWHITLHSYMIAVAAKYLFSLERATIPGSIYFLNLPIATIGWVLVTTAAMLYMGLRGVWLRLLAIFIVGTCLFGVVMTHERIILALPFPYTVLEFSFRLESYLLLGLSGAVLAALALAKQSENRNIELWMWTLLPVLLISLIGAVQQLDESSHEPGRDTLLSSYLDPKLPEGEQIRGLRDFYYIGVPTLTSSGKLPRIYIPPTAVHDDRASVKVNLSPGVFAYSNLASGPELVHLTGATIVGVSNEGNDVLQINGRPPRAANTSDPTSKRTETISVSPAHGLPIVLGRVLTLIGMIGLLARLITVAVTRRMGA